VKIVVNAYTGATTLYAFDPEDPILVNYRLIFPSLFKDSSAMPADLRRHVRYPEDLFKMQSEVYGLYHMTNPQVFSTVRISGRSRRRPGPIPTANRPFR
jgi:uncharacterized membrane protein (UPF0182 family)